MTDSKIPGSGRVSIRDVATRAGVSVGTVSNVLNQSAPVAASTRERVQEAIDALGFVRNESARQLRAGTSRTIGLIVLDISNPFFTDVARGVEDAASKAGVSVVLCNSDDDPAKEARYLSILAAQQVQGVLIVPAGAKSTGFPGLTDRGIPMVLLDRKASGTAVCSVSVDDIGGGLMAMSHLLEQGHRRVAFVGGGDTRQVVERHQGASQALGAQGMSPAGLLRFGTQALNVAGGREAGRQIAALPAHLRPTGVFCANDLLALGVMQEISAAGLGVGTDIAVIGYDDIDFAAVSGVPLSSVRQPRHALGYTATSLLLAEASDRWHRHQQVVFVPELVVRASSERPARDQLVG